MLQSLIKKTLQEILEREFIKACNKNMQDEHRTRIAEALATGDDYSGSVDYGPPCKVSVSFYQTGNAEEIYLCLSKGGYTYDSGPSLTEERIAKSGGNVLGLCYVGVKSSEIPTEETGARRVRSEFSFELEPILHAIDGQLDTDQELPTSRQVVEEWGKAGIMSDDADAHLVTDGNDCPITLTLEGAQSDHLNIDNNDVVSGYAEVRGSGKYAHFMKPRFTVKVFPSKRYIKGISRAYPHHSRPLRTRGNAVSCGAHLQESDWKSLGLFHISEHKLLDTCSDCFTPPQNHLNKAVQTFARLPAIARPAPRSSIYPP